MTNTPRTPAAGGFLIAVGAVVGAGVGLFLDQPTLGFLVGVGIGVVIAVGIWLVGRER